MSVLLKEFSFEISQANKVSGECVRRIFKMLHHACIQTFLAFHDSAFFPTKLQYSIVLYITARYLN